MKDPRQKYYVICCISIIVLWGFLWEQYSYDSKQATIAAETTVSNLSKSFEENMLGTIRHLDEFLVTLRRDYPLHQEQIGALLTSYNRHSVNELIIQLSITDANGLIIYSSKKMPDKPLDLSDREHFSIHLNSGDDNLFISKPVRGRVSKKWSLQFTRKILDHDGRFAGVIVLSVDPDYFTSFFQSIDVGSNGVITLLGMDGVIRARSSVNMKGGDPIGTSIPATNVQIDPNSPPVGIYHAPSLVDRVPRIVSYRRLKNYPLVVRVAVSTDEALHALHRHRSNIILQGVLASGGILLIFWLSFRLTTRQQQYTSELEAINSSLQKRIDTAISELRQKDQLMISQGRQAAMGDMIGNIAHQWRQPLNALAMVLGNIQQAFHYQELTAEYLDGVVIKGNQLIQKMSTTINDFRNFFMPDKEKTVFSAHEQIKHAFSLVEASFKSQNITIHQKAEHDLTLFGFPNEYSQVLLNLLSNSRDAIKADGAVAGHITIRLYERDGQGCVSVSDSGGGIPDDVIDKIFEPYFSTKEMGTGIGLYMSKMIIERSMNGTIEANNIDGGAEFVVVTPL